MKTIIKHFTAGFFLTLLLVVGNVQAKGTEVEILSITDALETKLELENWMTDVSIWNENSFVWIEQETEENMGVEIWMTNENTWNSEFQIDKIGKTETETELKLESWMTENNIWNR